MGKPPLDSPPLPFSSLRHPCRSGVWAPSEKHQESAGPSAQAAPGGSRCWRRTSLTMCVREARRIGPGVRAEIPAHLGSSASKSTGRLGLWMGT